MIRFIYGVVLRFPNFRGRHYLDEGLRRLQQPVVERIRGLRMELDPLEWNQLDLIAGKMPEGGTLDLMERLLRPGDTYVDVGAHVGLHVLIAARAVGPGGRVLAIEPQPYNCDRLLNNAAHNGFSNILVIAAAAGDREDSVVLPNQSRKDRTRLTLTGPGVSDGNVSFQVPLRRLDTLLAGHGVTSTRLMKIDVEGYEREVIAGAEGMLDGLENLIFECLPDAGDTLAADLAASLTARGFTLRCIDGSPWRPGVAAPEHNVWASRA